MAADYEGYFPRNLAERVISAWRLFLAVLLTLAGIVDSSMPPELVPLVQVIAFGYLTYSIGIVVLTWTRRVTTRGVPIVTHVIDLVIFTVLMFLTDGADSPFFPYFVFAAICGMIRWHGRGGFLTGAVALVAYVIATVTGTDLLRARGFDPAEFLSRCTQLALLAGILGYLGAYQHRLQREIRSLAAWPRRLPTAGPEALEEVLAYTATVLGAPRLVLVWEEGDEPSLRIAVRTGDHFEMSRQRPDAFDTLVAEPLKRSSFISHNAGLPGRRVLVRVPGGFRFWTGEPLAPKFRQRYGVKRVIALRLSSDNIEGWLFVLDRPRATPEDLLLGDIVGRLVAGTLELHTLIDQLRESAAGEERVRLARELHDGVLQSLTAASLQAQRARQSVGALPPDAERRLAMVEETILAEQQALRLAIEDLKPGPGRGATSVDAVPRLREAAMRVARQWDIRAHLNFQVDVPPVPQKLAHELTRMLQEALVNAVRHGAAREVTVTCLLMGAELALAVSYQGKGFVGFQGRHDLASLNEMKIGPRTLKERVAAAGGSLVIESGEGGARVEMRIPITPTR